MLLRSISNRISNKKIETQLVNALMNCCGKKAFVEESYLANYDCPSEHFHKDIILRKQYEGEIDLFVGGSPCQSFSFCWSQGGFDDARGTLFYDFVRLVDEINQRCSFGRMSKVFTLMTKANLGSDLKML